MTFGTDKSITDDIIVQEGTFGFSFTASGTVYGGALVKPAGPMMVKSTDKSTDNAVGVAAFYVTKGEAVTVYGPGNIVRGLHPSGTLAVGDDLTAGNNGCFNSGQVAGDASPVIGIALEATPSGTLRILLK